MRVSEESPGFAIVVRWSREPGSHVAESYEDTSRVTRNRTKKRRATGVWKRSGRKFGGHGDCIHWRRPVSTFMEPTAWHSPVGLKIPIQPHSTFAPGMMSIPFVPEQYDCVDI